MLDSALVHQNMGRIDQAARIYTEILEKDPMQVDALHLLGMTLFSEGNHERAAGLLNDALKISPFNAPFHSNLSSIYIELKNLSFAKIHAELAIKFDSNLPEAHYNLGNILFSQGEVDLALSSFSNVLSIDPDHQAAWANYLFILNFSEKTTPQEIFDANQKWGNLIRKKIGTETYTFKNTKINRRLILAYYLPELDKHVTPRYLTPILKLHDKQKFMLICYGFRTDKGSVPNEISDNCDRWVDVEKLSIKDIAKKMRTDKVDILLHPCTFKSRYRELLVHRAAPIQVACINLVSTTGLVETDYLISDNLISPVAFDINQYTEKIVRLSNFNTYKKFSDTSPAEKPPAKENGFVTFGSFNNLTKLNHKVLATWCEILKRVDNSRLLLKDRMFENRNKRSSFTKFFENAGIPRTRLTYSGFTAEHAEYLKTYNVIDISLDPFPFGGGTVSYESLWMGVPIITMVGPLFMGRLSASLLNRLQLTDWITSSETEYISTAVKMANNLNLLSMLRKDLRDRCDRTIFNADTFVQELEEALELMWRNYAF